MLLSNKSISGAISPSVLRDEERSSSSIGPNTIPLQDPSTTMLPTPDDISRWQYHIDLEIFGQNLHAAAKAVFPNTSRSRYKEVSVLMLCWEDEDPKLPVSVEIEKLDDVFRNQFGFHTDVWKIPGRNSHAELNTRILDLVRTAVNPKDHLFIVYYGGHAKLTNDRLLSWTSWRVNHDNKYPNAQWSGIQNALEQAESDVLILLDCCHAATATTSEGNGVTEMIAACDYNSIANGVGCYSFTKELTTELRELSEKPSFPVANLFRNIYSRIQARRPEDGKKHHPAPVHFSLTQDNSDYPRSIQLSVLPGHIKKPKSSNQDLSIDAQVVESDSEDSDRGRGSTPSRPSTPEQLINDTTETFPSKSISKFSVKKPRILLIVRLKDDCRGGELSVDLFKSWLRDMPAMAEEVKVEAGFEGFSSVAIVSIPLSLSLYLPRDPAIINVGPITSENLLQQWVHPESGSPAPGVSFNSEPAMAPDPPLQTGAETREIDYIQEKVQREASMDANWRSWMSDNKSHSSYKRVFVLLISWDPKCDDLNVQEEVQGLGNMFKDTYNFDVTVVQLDSLQKRPLPQAQAGKAVSDFVYKNDQEEALLIVYYAGHGSHGKEPGTLRMSARRRQNKSDVAKEFSHFNWNLVEANLKATAADVFLIFDCCHADAVRDSVLSSRSFETLAASATSYTSAPGAKSFTTALIWALGKLANANTTKGNSSSTPWFTTSKLAKCIRDAPHFPAEQKPILTTREVDTHRQIILAPLAKEDDNTTLSPELSDPDTHDEERENNSHRPQYLNLEFHFRSEQDEHDLKALALHLREFKKFRNRDLRKVEWGGTWVQGRQRFRDAIAKTMHQRKTSRFRTSPPSTSSSSRNSPSNASTSMTLDEEIMPITPPTSVSGDMLPPSQKPTSMYATWTARC